MPLLYAALILNIREAVKAVGNISLSTLAGKELTGLSVTYWMKS